MKKQTSVVIAAVILVSATFAGTAQAQGNGSIVIYRGATAETVRFDNRSGVTVARGQPAVKHAEPVRKVAHSNVRRMTAGDTLWIVDSKTDRLFACELRYTTQVSGRKIRCRSRRLPVALR